MQKICTLFVCLFGTSLALAESTTQSFWHNFSGNIAFTNNYIFRGVSQTNNNPALQGGLNYTIAPFGLYAYAFGSNVDFKTSNDKKAATEIDTTLGIKNDINDNLSYDVALQRYNYPGAHYANYNEVYGSFTYYFLTALIAYSGNEFNSHTNGLYSNLSAEYTLPCNIVKIPDVSIGAGIGHFTLQSAAGKSYNDFSIQISKSIKPVTFALQWTDTNHHYSHNDLDKSHLIASLTLDM